MPDRHPGIPTNLTIGERVAVYRTRRGYSQNVLAGLVGRTENWLAKVERNLIPLDRMSVVIRLAEALSVDPADLYGDRPDLAPNGHVPHPAVDRLTELVSRPAGRGSVAGEPVPLSTLATRARTLWSIWEESSERGYAAVGDQLPDLLSAVERSAREATGHARRQAHLLLSEVYGLARYWTKGVGDYELAVRLCDRAVHAADQADDPVVLAVATWHLATLRARSGRVDLVRGIISDALDLLRPLLPEAGPDVLSVWGQLHLLDAVMIARDDGRASARRSEAEAALEIAREAARKVRRDDLNHWHTAFGPLNVELHTLSVALEMGRLRQADGLVDRIDPSGAATVERRHRYYVEAARLHHLRRDQDGVIRYLSEADQVLAEAGKYDILVRGMLRDLLVQRVRSPRLYELARRAEVIAA